MIQLGMYRMSDDVILPSYGTTLSACFDLSFNPIDATVKGYDSYNNPISQYINGFGEISIYPGDRLLIPTGIILKILQNMTIETYADIAHRKPSLQQYSIRLHPRSGLALKKGLVLANAEGIVDVDYQEQVFVLLTNTSQIATTITKGDRVAQAEVVCNEPFDFVEFGVAPDKHSERSGGFGSTGVSV
jgi:dUTP pyrophosphatase